MTLPKHDAFISHNPHTHTHRHTHLLYLTCHDYSIGWMKETKDNNEETRRKRFMKVISNADYLPARPFLHSTHTYFYHNVHCQTYLEIRAHMAS